ncbi:MAG: sigma 54-interacting transcriptional regulator, partial [Planctomycetes bacterium]|nr:sigma 54-interacting transcriptional regulator [Planctomycetota bacterium]
MTEKLVLVASNDGILKHAREVTDEGGYDAVILYGELEGAIPQVQSILDRKEFRVFVSRGGTARFLRERFNLPIVEIAVTGQDILRALHPYAGSGKKLAVIGCKNVIAGAREIADILGEEIIYLETRDSDAVPGAIEEARAAGADIIVGDHHVTRRAEALGLPVVRIDSGKAAVEQAFQEAARLYAGTVQEKLRNRRFQTIMESIEEAVIAIDENGLITTFNPGAEKIFSTPERDAIGKRIETVVPNTVMPQVLHSGQELVGVIMDAGKTVIASSVKPLVVDGRVEGVVSTFRDITKIQQLEAKIRAEVVKKRLSAKKRFDEIIHASARMKDVIGKAVKYAKVDSTILILGESGTGKEILAQAIHNGSARHGGAFVAFNCAALPDNLLESELFGYVDGSFTGARKEGKKGLFEMAHGGTILLDEISEMNLNIQARILRVIQEKEVMRLGDDKIIPVDVRILAATNQNLWQCVQDGTFRQDLFYRLNVLNLTLPPLRDRREDVEPLARLFLAEFGSRYEASV